MMRRFLFLLAAALAAGLVAGCNDLEKTLGMSSSAEEPQAAKTAQAAQAASAAPIAKPVVLEAEAFDLIETQAVEDANASGGWAVRFDSPAARAASYVDMPVGRYIFTVYINAPDDQHAAINLKLGPAEPMAIRPAAFGRLVAVPAAQVNVTEPGIVDVVISASQTGMTIDRIEITQLD